MAKLYIGNSENLAQAIDLAADKLPLSGGTMTGAITLAADPTAAMEAATKQYVDQMAATGNGILPDGTTTTTADIPFAQGITVTNGTETDTLTVTGDATFEGNVSFGEGAKIEVPTPAEGSDAANKDYVDSAVSTAGDGKFLPLAGGTMTGAAVMAAGDMKTAQARNIYFTTTDLEAGVTALPQGSIAIFIG